MIIVFIFLLLAAIMALKEVLLELIENVTHWAHLKCHF
jgi:hypothetical protein